MPNKKTQLTTGEEQALGIVGRYRIGFQEAVASLAGLGDAADALRLLEALSSKDLLLKHSGKYALAPKCPYWTLTSLGAAHLGLNRERATINGTNALSTALSILWFSAFGNEEAKRMRVESSALNQAFGTNLHHNVLHAAEEIEGRIVIYRIYRPATDLDSIKKWCHDTLRNLPSSLKEAVEHGDYAIAVLSEYASAISGIRKELGRPAKRGGQPLLHQARIVSELGVSTESFPTEYKRKFG